MLSAFKLFAGVAAHSGAMISDGIHTASDVLSTLIVMAGVAMADRQSDKEHPYGHERMAVSYTHLTLPTKRIV